MTTATTVEPSAELKAANEGVVTVLEAVEGVLKLSDDIASRRYELYVAEFDAVVDDRDMSAIAYALGGAEVTETLERIIILLKKHCGGHELP